MSETIERFGLRRPVNDKRPLVEATDVSGNTLSAAEWQAFIATLEAPPEPNDALKAAWRDYHRGGLE